MERLHIANLLCGVSCLPEERAVCPNAIFSKCSAMGECCINTLSDQQMLYISTPLSEDIYLNACPGSGKTEVIGIKTAYEFNRWTQTNNGIAVLTFTNSAENELTSRIKMYLRKDIGYPHYVGTFTSWLHGYIANPFMSILTKYKGNEYLDKKIRLVESDCNSDFLNAYRSRHSYGILGKISANQYHFDTESIGTIIYDGPVRRGQQIIDGVLESITSAKQNLIDIKAEFWKKGFATYGDVEQLTCSLLKTHSEIALLIAKRFPVIIVDECQDLSYAQLEILRLLHEKGCIIHLVGDLDQAIYEFRLINPQKTEEFINSLGMKEQQLTNNYRSVNAIVCATGATLCKEKDYAAGCLTKKTDNPLRVILYKRGQEQQVLAKYELVLTEIGLDPHESRVIVRNNSLRQKLYGRKVSSQTVNTIEDFASFLYLRDSDSIDDYQMSIRVLARATQRCFFKAQQHATFDQLSKPENVDNELWRRIITAIQDRMLNTTELLDLNQTWGQWKNKLISTLSSEYLGTIPGMESLTFNFGRLRDHVKDTPVCTTFKAATALPPCKIETIHSCKGMSLDAVLFVSAYQKNADETGAYWTDWFAKDRSSLEENHRLAYVAFSRARHLLMLGIPNPPSSPLSEEQKEMFKSIGFSVECIE